VVVPHANLAGMDADETAGIELVGVERIGQALGLLLD
jgi:hypothetical protein